MSWFLHEWRLLVRSRLAVAALALLLLLSTLAVLAGSREVTRQQAQTGMAGKRWRLWIPQADDGHA